jgi:hypothetical protein
MRSSHVKYIDDLVTFLLAPRGEPRVTWQFRLFMLLLRSGAEVHLKAKPLASLLEEQ